MEHTMKCDYCKIHYEENEGVCPNCGMTPRKRWAKVLCAVAEVVFWMYWIMMIRLNMERAKGSNILQIKRTALFIGQK